MLWSIMRNIHIWSSFSFLAKLSLISWSFLSSESYESVFCFVKGQNLRMEAVVSGANLIIKVLKLPVPPTPSTYWEERGVVGWLQTPMAKHCQLCLWKAASVKKNKKSKFEKIPGRLVGGNSGIVSCLERARKLVPFSCTLFYASLLSGSS